MKEIELRFLNYNKADTIKKIIKLGGIQIHKPILYEYIVFSHPLKKDRTDSYIRVRKENNKVTLTYKCDLKSKYVDEYETSVSDYEQTIAILNKLGAKKRYQIQKLREKWKIKGCKEIVFDQYPGVPEYMEVECNSVKRLDDLILKLGLFTEKQFQIDSLFKELYDLSKRDKEDDLTFTSVKKVIKPYIRKNLKLFDQIINIQIAYIKKINHNFMIKEQFS